MVIVCFTFYLFPFLLSQKTQRVRKRGAFHFPALSLTQHFPFFPSPKPSIIHPYAPSIIRRLSFIIRHLPSNHSPFAVRH